MRILLQLPLLLLATIATAQQHQTYVYTRLNDSTRQFKSDGYEIHFHNQKKSTKNYKERRVIVNGDAYLLTMNDSKAGMIESIYDPAGTLAATVFLSGSNTNDIVTGGASLKWK